MTQLESHIFFFSSSHKSSHLNSENQILELFKHVTVGLICDYKCFPYVCHLGK